MFKTITFTVAVLLTNALLGQSYQGRTTQRSTADSILAEFRDVRRTTSATSANRSIKHVLDSTVAFYSENGGPQLPDYRNINTYSSDYSVRTGTYYYGDGSNWIIDSKEINTVDASERLLLKETLEWNAGASSFQPYSDVTYSYDGSGRLTGTVGHYGSSEYVWEYLYDSNDRHITTLQKSGQTGNFTQFCKYEMTYNQQEKLIEQRRFHRSNETDPWVADYRVQYEYDANGFLSQEFVDYDHETFYTNVYLCTYTNNAAGDRLTAESREWISQAWMKKR